MLAGFESLRDDRCEVTLPTEPFDTLASDAFFGDNPGLLATEAKLSCKYECNCGFCLQSRSETTRSGHIKDYYAKNSHHQKQVDSMQLKVIPFSH